MKRVARVWENMQSPSASQTALSDFIRSLDSILSDGAAIGDEKFMRDVLNPAVGRIKEVLKRVNRGVGGSNMSIK